MKFSTTVSIALLALAKLIVADSESFGLVVIRSGSPLQYAGVYSEDGKLYFGSNGNGLSAVVTGAGKLKLSDNTYAVVSSDGSVVQGSESDATSGFSVSNGYLAYNGVDGFNAISSGSTYIVSTKSSGSNDLGVAIRATSSSGSTIPDFSPEDSSSTSASASASASTSASASASATTTVAPSSSTKASVSTIEAVSQITDGQIQATTATFVQQTENGAGKAGLGMSAAALAAVAMLL